MANDFGREKSHRTALASDSDSTPSNIWHIFISYRVCLFSTSNQQQSPHPSVNSSGSEHLWSKPGIRGLKNLLQLQQWPDVFFICMTSSSRSKLVKHTGICRVLTRQRAKKHDVLKQFFTFFQLVCFNSKINQSFFAPFLPPLIRTQEGVKSQKIAKLHLKSTICFSQSLPESCNSNNWWRLSGPKKAVNYSVL